MDGEWSEGAVTMSGGEQKARRDGVSVDSSGSGPGSPLSPPPTAAPSTTSSASGKQRRSLQKRVVSVPLADVSAPRPKGVGEGNTPTDEWAWRKYGQKPIKGSPFPRAYYRCSSSKGCPARKQVERSQADPAMVLVTYSYEHNHSTTVANRAQQNRQAHKPKDQPDQPAKADDANVVSDSPPAAAAIEVHDEFKWLYDVVSVASSSSDAEAADDLLLYGPMFFGKAAVDTASGGAFLPDEFGFGDAACGERSEEDDAMFAGLGELPECAMVFRRHAGDGLAMLGGVKVEQPAEGTAMT